MSDDLSGFSMMDLFRAETESQTALLSEGLLGLEGQGGTPATFEALMRAAHSLKGAARIVGVDAAVRVAHVLEDCFVAAQHGTLTIRPGHVDVLLRAVDLLTRISLVPEGEVESWNVENEATIAAMVADLSAILTGATPISEPELPPLATPEPVTVATPSLLEKPPEPAKPETAERVVRVTADSLTRLVSLAGESLVQSRQLRPFADALLGLKGRQNALIDTLHALEEQIADGVSRPNAQARARELLANAKARANQSAQTLQDRLDDFEEFARRGEDLAGRLHHEVLASRMRPLADGIRGFPRMVRDVARQLGKDVVYEVRGETAGVDRDILDKLEAPLNHLIRNALDHAIESPEARRAAGKPPSGTIRLEARHRAGMLQLTLSDDGRGIDPGRLRAKVVERGLTTAAMAEQLTEAELLEFLFLPGFSTKDAVTELSGRGVGLDVVQNMVRAVGGIVRVSTQVGKGTRFALQLPITRSVIRALLVTIAGEPYAFPLNRIDRILVLSQDEIKVLEGRRHFTMDDQPVGLVEAAQVLELPMAAGAGATAGLAVVVASDRSHRFGVIVDAFLGERDLEVRPLDPRLGKVPDINSASVLENGVPVLIIDVEDLVRSIDNLLGGRRLKVPASLAQAGAERPAKRILVVDDSITVRELERQMLESRGYSVDIAVDGFDGWNAVRNGQYQLVISDVDMPRMDGIELVRSIKSDAQLKTIPVVIVSYKDREEDRLRGLDAGADSYLTKSSFHDQTLIETVIDLIGEARS